MKILPRLLVTLAASLAMAGAHAQAGSAGADRGRPTAVEAGKPPIPGAKSKAAPDGRQSDRGQRTGGPSAIEPFDGPDCQQMRDLLRPSQDDRQG